MRGEFVDFSSTFDFSAQNLSWRSPLIIVTKSRNENGRRKILSWRRKGTNFLNSPSFLSTSHRTQRRTIEG